MNVFYAILAIWLLCAVISLLVHLFSPRVYKRITGKDYFKTDEEMRDYMASTVIFTMFGPVVLVARFLRGVYTFYNDYLQPWFTRTFTGWFSAAGVTYETKNGYRYNKEGIKVDSRGRPYDTQEND